jgi:hypothetical protein
VATGHSNTLPEWSGRRTAREILRTATGDDENQPALVLPGTGIRRISSIDCNQKLLDIS